jgi:hypothetical protein
MTFKYLSGEEVRAGDAIRYHGENGKVEFVAAEVTGNREIDWYVEQYPPGGFMIVAEGFGSVFLTEVDEDLEFVSRKTD